MRDALGPPPCFDRINHAWQEPAGDTARAVVQAVLGAETPLTDTAQYCRACYRIRVARHKNGRSAPVEYPRYRFNPETNALVRIGYTDLPSGELPA